MPEIETEVTILNLTYVFRGFDAFGDLMRFCDEHASEVLNQGRTADLACDPEPCNMPITAAQPLRGNGGVTPG